MSVNDLEITVNLSFLLYLWLKWFHFRVFENLFAVKSISWNSTSRETFKMIGVDSEAVFAERITSLCSQTWCKGRKSIFCLTRSNRDPI